MRNNRMLLITFLVILLTSLSLAAWSQGSLPYSNGELDTILAPIALYPDPLIAQILPAATYPDELIEADDLIRSGRSRDIDRQYWDVSVKAVAYYPSVLHMMVDKPDWTSAVGQAYIEEPDHVMRSIQRLRARSRSYGYLSSNRYQRVYLDNGDIRIVPVQSRYIYVPQYNPQVVYVRRSSSLNSNLISFGLGLLIGAWLNRDVDWHHNRVYYHGWDGGGWIGNSRPRVSLHNTYYVNNDYRNRPIEVDRRVSTRDLGDYRNKIRSSVGTYSLPQSRRPTRSSTIHQRPIPSGRIAPSSTRQNIRSTSRPSHGAVGRISSHRAKAPSFRNAPKSNRQHIRSTARPSHGAVGRTSTHRANAPSFKNAPRSNRQNIRYNAKPGRDLNRSHGSSGSNRASTHSNFRSKGGDHGQFQHGSKGGDHGQSRHGGKGR